LWHEFDPAAWDESWTFWRRRYNQFRRTCDKMATEPSDAAARRGGPDEPPG
jgi:hypothetical protein